MAPFLECQGLGVEIQGAQPYSQDTLPSFSSFLFAHYDLLRLPAADWLKISARIPAAMRDPEFGARHMWGCLSAFMLLNRGKCGENQRLGN